MFRKIKNKLVACLAACALAFAGCGVWALADFALPELSLARAETSVQETQAVTPTVKIESKNLSYSDSVYILYAVSFDGFDESQNEVKMLLWDTPQTAYTVETAQCVKSAQYVETVNGKNCIVFYSDGIAARELGDTIYCRAYVSIKGKDGEKIYYSEIEKFSAVDYVYEMKKGELTDKQSTAFTALLQYGGSMQSLFDYKTERLANGTFYTVNVVNGKLSDGFAFGRYSGKETVTIIANPATSGYTFTGWTDEKGNVVSSAEQATVTLTADKTYTANYEKIVSPDEPEEPSETVWREFTEGEFVYKTDEKVAVLVSYLGTGTDVQIPAVAQTFPVVEIGAEAFRDNKTLKTIVLPDSVTSIDKRAFHTCTALTSITFSATLNEIGDYAFSGCTLLAEVSFPNTLMKIGVQAFYNCKAITSLTLPASLQEMGDSAFHNLTKLTSLTFETGIQLKTIPNSAFYGCNSTSLKNVCIPKSVETIEQRAFYNCRFTSLTFEEGSVLHTIGDSAFYGARFTSLTFPDTFTTADGAIFGSSNSYLTTLTLPKSFREYTTTVNAQMRFFLAGLSKLTNLYVHAENPYFITEDSVLYTKDPMTGERSDTLIGYPKGKQTSNFTYTIPDGVTTVGTYAFYGNAKLQTLVISSNVQTIQEYAFQNCPSLTSLQFEERESVLSLGDRAFYGCSRLNGISETQEDGTTKNVFTIPATVKMDGIYVFGNCFRTSVTNLHVVFEDGNVSTSLDWTFYGCTGIIGVENIPAKLTSMNRTFSGCTKLQSVDFADDPDGMIESMAGTFYNCSSLVNVELPKVGILTTAMTISGDYNPTSTSYIGAFQRCTALQSVTVEACTEIGDSAFNGCTALQSVKISNGVTSIGRGAFYGCTALTEIALNGDVEKIPDYAFMNCTALEKVEVSDSVKTIGTSAFENCSALTEFTIPAEVVGIGERAFYGCAGLNNATIEKVETLGEYAFYGCAGLQTVNIPASLKIVPAYAFADCTGVKTVDLAEGVETIGDFAFMNMSQVTSFVLPASVQSIGAGAFSGWTALQSFAVNGNHFVLDNGIVYSADRTQIVVVLPSVAGDIVIPDQVTELAEGAFMNSKITSIVLSDNIKVIPARTFQGCTYLTSVKMPSALERIGNMAFEGCTALKSITIPKTVYSSFDKTYADPYEDGYTVGYYPANDCDGIGHYAFGNCTALQNVVFEEGGTKRLSFGDFAFYGCTSLQGTLNEITGEYEFIIPARVRGDAIPIYAYINPENPGAGNAHDRYAQGIGMYAFARCTALTNVVFEAVNGTEIPEPLLLEIGAFYECSALKSVTFNGALRSVSISLQGAKGDTVTYTQAAIAENAFYGCTALTTLNFAAEASFEYAATAFNGLNVALPTGAVMVDGSTGEKWGEDETYWYVDNADYFGVDGCLLCKDDCEFYDPHNGVFI